MSTSLAKAIQVARRNAAQAMGLELRAVPNRVVLFGSRAAALAIPESDWDILLVHPAAVHGPHGKYQVRDKAQGVDVVVVPSLEADHFLRHELGAHVAWYGMGVTQPLPDLRQRVDYRTALEYGPARRARSKLKLLLSVHPRARRSTRWSLDTPMMAELATRAVLDIARIWHLMEGRGSPPGRALGREWIELDGSERLARLDKVVYQSDLQILPDIPYAHDRFDVALSAAYRVIEKRVVELESLPRVGQYG